MSSEIVPVRKFKAPGEETTAGCGQIQRRENEQTQETDPRFFNVIPLLNARNPQGSSDIYKFY